MAAAVVEDMDVEEISSSAPVLSGFPVQILDFEFEEKDGKRVSKLVLLKQDLDSVSKKAGDREVVFISIAGPSRRGKSFLLDFMLRFLNALNGDETDWIGWDDPKKPLTGFKWRNGYDRETSGMWIWSEPFIVKKDDGNEVAVFIMDTQGVFDEHTSQREWSTIVGLSLLTSSCLIFNMFGDIQEDSLLMLDNFIEYGRLASEGTDGVKPFQKLVFLFRDWNNPGEFPYGAKGGEAFITKKLEDKPHLLEDSRRVRKNIHECFEEIECFLMPEPGEAAKMTGYDGSLEGLNKKFSTHVEKFITKLLSQDELSVKTIGGVPVKASSLPSLFEEYTEIFNSDETPKPITILEATARITNQNLYLKAKQLYKLEMQKKLRGNAFLKDRILTKTHKDAVIKCEKLYNSARKMGEEAIAQEFLAILQEELQAELPKYQESNQAKKEQALKRAVEENALEYRKTVAVEIDECFMEPSAFAKLSSREKGIFQREYTESMEACEEELVEKFLPLLFEKMDEFEASLKDKNDFLRSEAERQNSDGVENSLQLFKQKFDQLLSDGQFVYESDLEAQLKTMKKEVGVQFQTDDTRKGSRAFLKKFDVKLTEALNLAQEFYIRENRRNKEQAQLKMEKLITDCIEYFEGSMKSIFDSLGFKILANLDSHFRIHETETIEMFSGSSVISNNVVSLQFLESLKEKMRISKEQFEEHCTEKQKALQNSIEAAAREALDDFEKTLTEHVNKFCPLLEFDDVVQKTTKLVLQDYKFKSKDLFIENREDEIAKLVADLEKSGVSKTVQLKLKIDNEKLESNKMVSECKYFYQKEIFPFVTDKLPKTEDELEEIHTKAKEAAMKKFLDERGFSDEDEFARRFLNEIVAGVHEAYEQMVDLFRLKKEESENFVKNALQDAKKYYHEEMEKHIQNTIFLEPKVLEKCHRTATKIAIKNCADKITMSSEQQQDLSDAMKVLFISYQKTNAMNTPTDPAIGIDLGTKYSCVGVYVAGKVHIIPNDGKNTTPSIVSFKDTCELIGEPAKSQAHVEPENTIFDAKRLIGRKFEDASVQKDMKLWPFKVIEEVGVPKIEARAKTYHPEQIAAYILTEMKQIAEKFLKCPVKKAVITVPAYFTDGQKQATIDAGKIADLEVLQILSEPTAAAIAYRLQCKTDENSRTVLIFDLGGGTFDVAILKIKGGDIDVLIKDGDTHLGGGDFDDNIVDYCVAQHLAKTRVNLVAGRNSASVAERHKAMKTLRRLRDACEPRKRDLSSAKKVDICVDAIDGKSDLRVSLTREKFEQLNQYLFDDTLKIVERIISDAKLTKKDIDDIVLVGGSSRIPKIQQMLTDYFEGKALDQTVSQDEAVAYGAAVQAAILNGNIAQESGHYMKLSDVTPRSLGVYIKGDIFSVIIPKSTKNPTTKSQIYWPSEDYQTSIHFKVYEGEDPVATKNHLLGTFDLSGIPPARVGVEKVDVEMDINEQGILHVTAVCLSNGQTKDLTITENKFRLTEAAIDKILSDGRQRRRV